MKVGDKFELMGMKFHIYKATYEVNGKKCFMAAANGIREIYHQLIVQENGFIYGTTTKVTPISKETFIPSYI